MKFNRSICRTGAALFFAVLSSAHAQPLADVTGVWMSNGYLFITGITINGVAPNGNLSGCYWGWNHIHWHNADNSIGDPALYDTAQRFIQIFGTDATATLNGTSMVITNHHSHGVYALTVNGAMLEGGYSNPVHPTWARAWKFFKTQQRGTNCP